MSQPTVLAPATYASNEPGAFVTALRSPWYALIADLQETLQWTTVQYARSQGLKSMWLPLTTRTITCPTALGSDSEAVSVHVVGVDTYLPDSMQFLLEYAIRLAPGGSYSVLPSFRGETPDRSHLNQFTHSEVELPGGLDDLVRYVDGYVKALAQALLDDHGDRLGKARGDVSHIERMAARAAPFERVTLDEAVRLVGDVDGCVRDEGDWRTLTRKGERLLMSRVDEFVWMTHHDSLSVPFYQAFGDDERTALCADLFFGVGEVVGSGERHATPDGLRKSMAMHNVREDEYEWYVRLREEAPMRTSGFGMGFERFLMWVLNHDDIRDIPLVSRVDEPLQWPPAVVRP
ncbi:amino acid--tRNA ligase-related protein [Actinocrispum wychmicini]|uniref:Asparaginyl-tRNA synthetase n=1 Tax=Actinocrispum wychmicini TaxID=1213861 RepID=A0A4R2JAF4_9PSEU|nr:amino acid--tRNA ligase-related protein [Actinocrispum wychmicini]TCO55754.1 asparaginyl-tRNA synthetase [Actinocrispum wychmicini]